MTIYPILCGGETEREDSIVSAQTLQALMGERGVAAELVVLNDFGAETLASLPRRPSIIMLHGGAGEGGPLQAYLEMTGVPFTGSRFLASALALDKWVSKALFARAGVSVPAGAPVGDERDARAFAAEVGYPIVLKPVDQGSSLGVQLARDDAELAAALRGAPGRLVAERYVAGRNVTVALAHTAGGFTAFRPLVVELRGRALYDAEAKGASVRDYALLPDGEAELEQRLTGAARACHEALGCFGLTRVDFVVDAAGTPHALEVNTVPGLSRTGNYLSAVRLSGMGMAELVDLLLDTFA